MICRHRLRRKAGTPSLRATCYAIATCYDTAYCHADRRAMRTYAIQDAIITYDDISAVAVATAGHGGQPPRHASHMPAATSLSADTAEIAVTIAAILPHYTATFSAPAIVPSATAAATPEACQRIIATQHDYYCWRYAT